MSTRKLTKQDLKSMSPNSTDKDLSAEMAEMIKRVSQAFAIHSHNTHASMLAKLSIVNQMYGDKYQQPERDEQGTLYGYKILVWNLMEGKFFSPIYPVQWESNGTLQADKELSTDNGHGIYCVKCVDDPELNQIVYWLHDKYGYRHPSEPALCFVLVKLAVYGDVIEGKTGFRGQKAKIIGVMINGNWKSYEDSQEYSRAYRASQESRREYEASWEEKDRYINGNWNPRS